MHPHLPGRDNGNNIKMRARNTLYTMGNQLMRDVAYLSRKDHTASLQELSVMLGRVQQYILVRKSLSPDIGSDVLTNNMTGTVGKLKKQILSLSEGEDNPNT